MPIRVAAVQSTPNPNAMKFCLTEKVCESPVSFFRAADGRDHPIAGRLFAIAGVEGVLLLNDFVTINKAATAAWKAITPAVKKVLNGLPEGAADE